MLNDTDEKPAHNTHNCPDDYQNGCSVDSVQGSKGIQILFLALKAAGVELIIDDGRLAFESPGGVMSPELLTRVRAERDGLLAALQGEQVDSPKPSGVSCPYCRGESLEDVELGWRCCNCKRLGWIWLPGGSIVRADCEHMDLEWN
jgi:hypothetical protein